MCPVALIPVNKVWYVNQATISDHQNEVANDFIAGHKT